ncbi:MAG: hypothetical protein COW00_01870 [Bdellovibrio sp. CG12_big_fil_rev_8_21_14_0_65_39_13]|nr:MAG: hypothetical protein COW78_09700 [Bdellovibrio sp. CG22_combo_CG10-13_8_21_14_all_39_27]PIQ62347.1 MAG: hypothetical protein COW00_01870 [Bdellovibrio sp. CG12_big_fil_rev_8_21_14_0_65_39_13]PIR32381.1 MAG: hypothetical protein COV37_19960 [Bdellovibrio sp. CG11_big_fil_rev_8_21_14_0_20_39_38]
MQKQKPTPQSPSPSSGGTLMKTFDEGVMMFIDLAQESIVMFGIGLSQLVRLLVRFHVFSLTALYAIYVFTRIVIKDSWHLELLYKSAPTVFTPEKLDWFLQFSLNQHHFAFLLMILFIVCVSLGFKLRYVRTKFIKIFITAGLTNGKGDTPKLVGRNKLDKFRVQYDFDANGVGLSEFKDKQERIEAQFGMEVESIKMGKNPGRALITFNKRKFPETVSYQDVSEEKVLAPDSFYVGHSVEGVVTQKISDLPHMLVAGTTGSGKSVFFKQCLVGLLESTKHLQLYIIDLKGGLEAIDFKDAPNVKIVKTMQEAVMLLRQVEKEMKDRFKFLENNALKTIVPGRDKKDRIVVAVDEASVLYMERSRYDDDFKIALEARKLADSISKLSRAASIHLLLATQKLDRTVIPVSVSENISGRMAFRANSLQGSLVVLGSKDAAELPKTPGRGIWNVGNQKMIVQAPFISDEEIKRRCKRIANEFEANERFLFNDMIDELDHSESEESKEVLKGLMNKGFSDETKKQDRDKTE